MSKRRIEHDIFGTEPKDKINSKQKGIKGEFAAAKFLTEWTGVKFTRTPASGGLRWIDASLVCGDVVCTDMGFLFPFTVEVKFYKKFEVKGSLRENSIIYTWWTQVVQDAARSGKKPMLMCRMNGMPKGEFYIVWDWEVVPPSSHVGFKPVARGVYERVKGQAKYLDDLYLYKGSDILQFYKFPIFVQTLNTDKL